VKPEHSDPFRRSAKRDLSLYTHSHALKRNINVDAKGSRRVKR